MKNQNRRFVLALVLILTSTILVNPSASAWSGPSATVSVIGGGGSEEVRGMTLDRSGNSYLTGYFNGTVDFDPGDGVTSLTTLGGNDVFILKLSSDGSFLWVKRLGGTLSEAAASIVIDKDGNVITTGNFAGTVDFNPGAEVANLTSAGLETNDAFISKLDSSGNYLWAKSFGGIGDDRGLHVATDFSGNICVTGIFEGTADFDPGVLVANLAFFGNFDVFISKFDSSGNYRWGKSVGDTERDLGQGVSFDSSGFIYSFGEFKKSVDFNPGGQGGLLTADGNNTDMFISKFDSAGTFLWAKRIGGTGADSAAFNAFDSEGNIVVAGYFNGTVDFDPSERVETLTAIVSSEMFIAKFTPTGNYLWAKRIGGTGADRGLNIAVDSIGNIYSTGKFTGTVDFNPGGQAGVFSSYNNSEDVFISKYNPSGSFLWAKHIGGAGADRGLNIAVDSSGNVYSAGYFSGPSVDFNPGEEIANFTNSGGYDIYILKLTAAGEVDLADAAAAYARGIAAAQAAVAKVAAEAAAAAAKVAAEAAAAKREAEKQSARADIAAAVKSAKDLTVDSFAKAEIPGINSSNIEALKAELLALPEESRTDFNQVLKVARKFEIVGNIASDQGQNIFPNIFVEVGLISQTSKNKVALVSAVKKLPATARDSYAEIKAAIEVETKKIQARQDRLASVIARNATRANK
jgi:hypothetical protein